MVENDVIKLSRRTSVVIPTLNASAHLETLLPALSRQNISREMILFVDSSSTDDTADKIRSFGARLHRIPREDFNHGGTRRLATLLCDSSEYIIFLTQDAVPDDSTSLQSILAPFNDPAVGAAYGRQLPRAEATPIERHARLYNYPFDSSVRSYGDRRRLGIKVIFNSDSFAAYNKEILEEIGGFPKDAFFGEDQIVAAKMLLGGYKVAYAANAKVVHSHGYSITQDFKRYFDVGVFHGRNPWLFNDFQRAEGEGRKFVKSELAYLLKEAPADIPGAIARTAAKYLAYSIGKKEARMPAGLKRRLSASPYYWR